MKILRDSEKDCDILISEATDKETKEVILMMLIEIAYDTCLIQYITLKKLLENNTKNKKAIKNVWKNMLYCFDIVENKSNELVKML